MSFFTILSGVIGGVSALTQNIIEKKQERKAELQRYQQLLQLEELRLQTANANRVEAHEKSFTSFAQAVTQSSKPLAGKYKSERIANFIVALTRPLITFILLGFVVVVSLRATLHEFFILETAFSTLDYTLAYWFVRRSFEKKTN
jgi:hypothetical protein